MLREVVLTHMHDLDAQETDAFKEANESVSETFKSHLGIPFLVSPLLISATAARCDSDDIVVLKKPDAVASVKFHLQYAGEFLTLVQYFQKAGVNRFKPCEGNHLVSTNRICGAIIHKNLEDGEILVAPPSFYT